jgi:hypothetical protein
MNTPDTEWEKELRKKIQMFFYNAEHPEVYSSYEIAMFERKVEGILSIFQNTVSSRDTYWKGTNQVFVNNIIEDIENMKGVYSAQDAITKALEIIKRHTIR